MCFAKGRRPQRQGIEQTCLVEIALEGGHVFVYDWAEFSSTLLNSHFTSFPNVGRAHAVAFRIKI